MLKFVITAIVLLELWGNPIGIAFAHLFVLLALALLALKLPRLVGDLFRPARRI